MKVTIDTDGEQGTDTAEVTATDGHPFWVPELGEWIDATDLRPGQWLQTGSGTWVQITAVERWTTPRVTVHNLTVANTHTYYVVAGTTSVLVHNCGEAGEAGEAIVHLDREAKHALITIRNGDEVLHTHQFGGVNIPTNGVAEFDPATLSPYTIHVRIPLPNPGAQWRTQKS